MHAGCRTTPHTAHASRFTLHATCCTPHAARRTPHAAHRTPHTARRTTHVASPCTAHTPHAARCMRHAARCTLHAAGSSLDHVSSILSIMLGTLLGQVWIKIRSVWEHCWIPFACFVAHVRTATQKRAWWLQLSDCRSVDCRSLRPRHCAMTLCLNLSSRSDGLRCQGYIVC